MSALGAYQSAIPSACWGTDGFRDCANTTWQLAQQACINVGSPGDDCAGPIYDVEVMASCPCNGPLAPSATAAAAAASTADDLNDEMIGKIAVVALFGVGLYLVLR